MKLKNKKLLCSSVLLLSASLQFAHAQITTSNSISASLIDNSSIFIPGATQPQPSKGDFNFIVMADPQSFRLMHGGDPNSESANGAEWRAIHTNLIKAINTMNASFGIINGDMTEFGRANSWKASLKMFNQLKFPYYFGLGNHDYQNNAHDCWDATYMTIDGCAIRSVDTMLSYINLYKNKLDNFSVDWNDNRGSLSYSWDYKGVHFVQLHNHPNYQVKLRNTWSQVKYDIIPSLTWLAEDLRLARLRGVTNIILNLHEYRDDFTSSASSYARRQFNAIMKTYKPLAVFAGHDHQLLRNRHYNDSFYGDTTVYRTGATFDGKFHAATYHADGTLTVTEMSGKTGKPVALAKYQEVKVTPNPICKLSGQSGKAGDIYSTTFLPATHQWNLRQILRSGNNVDVSKSGTSYMRAWNEGNPYQIWKFEKAYGDSWPEFNSWYTLKQLGTGKVLDSNAAGKVYTNYATPGNAYQQWWPIKTERGELMLLNRATKRFLDGNGTSLYTNAGYEAFNQYKVWQVSHGWNRKTPDEIRYFKANQNGSWKQPFPSGTQSNTWWSYAGKHDFLSPSPCIGW